MYNFADSAVTASAYTAGANTALTLVASTAGLTTTASLVIYYDDQLQSTAITISNFPATQPVSIASVTIGNTVTIAGTVTANPTGTQTIAGTVTANGLAVGSTVANVFPIGVDTQFSGVRTVTDLIGYRLPISLGDSNTVVSASLSDPLPAGTNRIGVVTIGAGTVTIGAGTAQIGSVTASLQFTTTAGQIGQDGLTKILQQDPCPGLYQNDIQPYGVPIAFIDPSSQGQPTFRVVGNNGNSLPVTITTGNSRIGVVTIGAGTVTIGAGTAQIGSVTASISGTVPISISSVTIGNSVTIGSLPAISGTVTANLAISSTPITKGSFTSLASATLVPANTSRKMATVYNLGAGQLFVNAGATATTLGGGFMVALSSGDFYECDYTTTTLSAIFATAGTASWVSH
jgi:hypothetical protein